MITLINTLNRFKSKCLSIEFYANEKIICPRFIFELKFKSVYNEQIDDMEKLCAYLNKGIKEVLDKVKLELKNKIKSIVVFNKTKIYDRTRI